MPISYDDLRCFACGGPFHPATGNHFLPGVDYCGACYRVFLEFLKTRFYKVKPGKPDFYA